MQRVWRIIWGPVIFYGIFYGIFLPCATALAQYPSAKPNFGIREEVDDDSDRLIPVTDHFAFAVDGETFFRNNGAEEFYHGIGYWLQVRSEAAPNPFLRANVRSIFYSGSCSGGYVEPSQNYHLFAFTAKYPRPILNGSMIVRGPIWIDKPSARGWSFKERNSTAR